MNSLRKKLMNPLTLAFNMMRAEGGRIMAERMAAKAKQPNDPHRKLREASRRESVRWNTANNLPSNGKRAGERIARQIAKGQLKKENGLG